MQLASIRCAHRRLRITRFDNEFSLSSLISEKIVIQKISFTEYEEKSNSSSSNRILNIEEPPTQVKRTREREREKLFTLFIKMSQTL